MAEADHRLEAAHPAAVQAAEQAEAVLDPEAEPDRAAIRRQLLHRLAVADLLSTHQLLRLPARGMIPHRRHPEAALETALIRQLLHRLEVVVAAILLIRLLLHLADQRDAKTSVDKAVLHFEKTEVQSDK